MAREIEMLSQKATEHAKWKPSKEKPEAKRPIYLRDGGGLYLQVSAADTKSWIFVYTRAGKTREMGLGSFPDYSLKEARESAKAKRKLLAEGVDPIDARGTQRAQEAAQKAGALNFAECVKRYIVANSSGWKNEKHAAQWQSTLDEYAAPIIGALPVQDVDTARVLRVLEQEVERGGKKGRLWDLLPETASRVRGRIEKVLGWAKTHDYRKGDNPAVWRNNLQNSLPKRSKVQAVRHHPALPYAEMGAFAQALRALPGTAPQALEFCILTAARTGEAIGAKPEEFDLKKGTWTIPASRMKAGREHRVPLSPRAVEIIKAQPEGAYVFGGRYKETPLSNMAMLEVVRGMGRKDLTVHGFRSTFRDWAAESTSYPNELCEMALAHTLSDKTEAAYRRGDLFEKRRLLMLDWARFCNTPKRSAKVTPIRKGAA